MLNSPSNRTQVFGDRKQNDSDHDPNSESFGPGWSGPQADHSLRVRVGGCRNTETAAARVVHCLTQISPHVS
jgi:hypothetical protein